MLDAAGICCESGVLDDCGRCDGDHSSCYKAIEFSVMMLTFDDALSLAQPAVNSAFRCAYSPLVFCALKWLEITLAAVQ